MPTVPTTQVPMGVCVRCGNRVPEFGVPWEKFRTCLDCHAKPRPYLRRRLIPRECFEHRIDSWTVPAAMCYF